MVLKRVTSSVSCWLIVITGGGFSLLNTALDCETEETWKIKCGDKIGRFCAVWHYVYWLVNSAVKWKLMKLLCCCCWWVICWMGVDSNRDPVRLLECGLHQPCDRVLLNWCYHEITEETEVLLGREVETLNDKRQLNGQYTHADGPS